MTNLWMISLPNSRVKNNSNSNSTSNSILSSDITNNSIVEPEGGCIESKLNSTVGHLLKNKLMVHLKIPPLNIGTLDTLLPISDNFNTYNNNVENLIKKLEEYYLKALSDLDQLNIMNDSYMKSLEPRNNNGVGKLKKENSINFGSTSNSNSFSSANIPPLSPISTVEMLKNFEWDTSLINYSNKTIGEITEYLISNVITKYNNELIELTNNTTLHNTTYNNVFKKKNLNLLTSPLNDFLEESVINRLQEEEANSSDIIVPLFAIVPNVLVSAFKNNYQNFGSEIVEYFDHEEPSSPNMRSTTTTTSTSSSSLTFKSSPIIPDSLEKVYEDEENTVFLFYSLKGHYSSGYIQEDGQFVEGILTDFIKPLSKIFKENKILLREYNNKEIINSNIDIKVGEDDFTNNYLRRNSVITRQTNQYNLSYKNYLQSLNELVKWCQNNFSVLFSTHIHLRMVQSYVESVLRYGLPLSFSCFLFFIEDKNEKEFKKKIMKNLYQISPEMKKIDLMTLSILEEKKSHSHSHSHSHSTNISVDTSNSSHKNSLPVSPAKLLKKMNSFSVRREHKRSDSQTSFPSRPRRHSFSFSRSKEESHSHLPPLHTNNLEQLLKEIKEEDQEDEEQNIKFKEKDLQRPKMDSTEGEDIGDINLLPFVTLRFPLLGIN